ncbi:MAG: CDP-alcohol phosphatidyltransferase family protein, partial [Methylocella sp.]
MDMKETPSRPRRGLGGQDHDAKVLRLRLEASEFEKFVPPPRGRGIRAVPLRVILPNLVTLLALCMGLTAIRFAIEGQFETAVVAVIAAAILDGLDGRIARALRGTSRFGAELDSLADFVAFGVAPA